MEFTPGGQSDDSAKYKFIGRRYRLTLDGRPKGSKGEEGKVVFEGGPDHPDCLDVEFDVSVGLGQCFRKGTISVTGFSVDRISQYVATSCLISTAAAAMKLRVTLEAGYQESEMITIIDGYVISGRQSPPPEIKLTMEVNEMFNAPNPCVAEVSVSEPTKLSAIIGTLLEPYGVNFSQKDSLIGIDEKALDVLKTVPAEKRDQRAALLTIAGMIEEQPYVYVDHNMVYLQSRNPGSGKDKAGTVTMGKDSGLLSISGIEFTGINFTAFLQDMGGPYFPNVMMDSEFNVHVNKIVYMLMNKRFVGHYRGREWYLMCHCMRVGEV